MRRLTEHAAEQARPEEDGERGVAAIFVAVILTVLLGMGAIVIDVGAVYQERRELQNGADAAAFAVAEDCAKGDCGSPAATADPLADANADDDLSALDGVVVDMTAQTAKVDTSTSDSDGGSRILHWFAPVLGIDGTTVRASATAQWSALQSGPGVPLTFSKCEWDNAMGGSPTYPSATVALTFHDGNSTESCAGPAGQDLPGGFGWLDTDGDCEVELTVGGTYSSDPGASPPSVCDPDDFIGRTVLVPVYGNASGTGQGGSFEVWGLATFEITGMRLLMGNTAWTAGDISLCSTGNNPLGGVTTTTTAPKGKGGAGGGPGSDQSCLAGHFVKDVILSGTAGKPGSVPDLGTQGIRLIA